MHSALVIDDDETVREVLRSFLTAITFEVTLAATGEEGRDLLRARKFDIILTDLVMPGISGMDILHDVSATKLAVPVIVLTAFGTVQTAVEAMRKGAFDYLTKPFNLEELKIVITKALAMQKLQKENVSLKIQLRDKYDFKGIVGQSASMTRVYELIDKIADTDSTVLIMGESGTGKELIAKTIHYNSSRSLQPFVPINCAAIPRDLLESELFGHEKGAFTGAVTTRVGRFELAQNGTLFLDEVGDLDPALQVKLLRVLQEREFERVGGMKTIKVDVRIVAATNRDLERSIVEGKFREDLLYRLNVIPITLPPLRERTDDLTLLIEHFVKVFSKKRKRDPLVFSGTAMQCLMKYRWPGNVRELENLIDRLTLLVSGNTVDVSDLPDKIRQETCVAVYNHGPAPDRIDFSAASGSVDIPPSGIDLNKFLHALEKNLITQALERTGGVRSRAAQLLGLNRTTLLDKLKKLHSETPAK